MDIYIYEDDRLGINEDIAMSFKADSNGILKAMDLRLEEWRRKPLLNVRERIISRHFL